MVIKYLIVIAVYPAYDGYHEMAGAGSYKIEGLWGLTSARDGSVGGYKTIETVPVGLGSARYTPTVQNLHYRQRDIDTVIAEGFYVNTGLAVATRRNRR